MTKGERDELRKLAERVTRNPHLGGSVEEEILAAAVPALLDEVERLERALELAHGREDEGVELVRTLFVEWDDAVDWEGCDEHEGLVDRIGRFLGKPNFLRDHRTKPPQQAHDVADPTVARLRALLREVEWSGPIIDHGTANCCSFCGGFADAGHAPDCRLAAELKG